jgi:hypothetical protein
MGKYHAICGACDSETITDGWSPQECPFCELDKVNKQNEKLKTASAQLGEMETALRKLIKVFPRNLSCNELHHSKNEYHADDKECPVVENTRKALEEAEQLLKKYE